MSNGSNSNINMNSSKGLVKYILLIINVVFAFIGLALIVIGVYVLQSTNEKVDILGDSYNNTPIFFIILGIIVFVIAFFCVCGACMESRCMTYAYAALLLILITAQIAGGIFCFFMKPLEKKVPTAVTIAIAIGLAIAQVIGIIAAYYVGKNMH